MSEELMIYTAEKAIAKPSGTGYLVSIGLSDPVKLKRDVDFGVIPKTKKPTLYKSGAEKIALGYGMFQRYDIESKIETAGAEAPMFYYVVKCSLVKLIDGKEYVFTTGYGSSNTNEKRNGFNSAWDSANGTLKMAQKRALTSAAISISGLSDMFTQDMENEDFMANSKDILKEDSPDSKITAKQIKRIFAIAAGAGLNPEQAKRRLAAMGFASTKDVTQEKYNEVCEALEALMEKKTEGN